MKKHPGLGVNVALKNTHPDKYPLLVDKLNLLGVEWLRLEFDFHNPQNLHNYEKFVHLCRKSDIKILGLLTGAVPGNLLNLFWPQLNYKGVTNEISKYLSYVTQLTSIYRKKITHWEVWNEPNLKRFWPRGPDPREYANLLSLSYRAIKKVDKNNTVVFGGIFGNDHDPILPGHLVQFARRCLNHNTSKVFDIMAFHPYSFHYYFSYHKLPWYINNVTRDLNLLTSYARNLSIDNIWFTEFGISNRHVALTKTEIASVYTSLYSLCKTKNIPLFLWVLFDDPASPFEPLSPEKHFGLLDQNLEETPVFKSLVNQLSLIEM